MNNQGESSGAGTVAVGRSGEDAENQPTVGTELRATIGASARTGAAWASLEHEQEYQGKIQTQYRHQQMSH